MNATNIAYGSIYVGTCSISKKQYVGQTISKDPMRYCEGHLREVVKGGHKIFYNAIRKYGVETFSFELVGYASDQTALDLLEDFFIIGLNTLAPHGYNVKRGGAHGPWSGEGKRRLSAAVKVAMAIPDIKERMLLGQREAVNRPSDSDRRREIQARPSVKLSICAGIKAARARPEVIQKFIDNREFRRQIMRDAANRPETRLKLGSGVRGVRWINNGKKNRALKPIETLSEGWSYGRVRGLIWITDGISNDQIRSTEDIPEGWHRGLKRTAPRKRWITDGIKTSQINEDQSLPEGWRYGRS